MADNLILNAGTGGGTVATDEIGGFHYQWMKLALGGDGTASYVTEALPLPVVASGTVTATPTGTQNVFVSNSGTIVPSGTQNVFVENSGTTVPSGTQNVFVSNNGTVTANGGTILGAGGTVNTVPSGTQNVFVSNSATVTANGGTILGQAGTVTALQGTDPWVTSISSGTVILSGTATASISGTASVHITNAATVTANIGTGGTLLGQAGTVTVVPSGTQNVFVSNSATVTGGSVVVGQGWTLGTDFGATAINLTATGTVIPAVASKRIYVYSEAYTVQGGTVTVTTRQGAAGGTISGPMQFEPRGGIAQANPIEAPLYIAAAGSPVVYELEGSGTVGGRIAWVANA